MDINAIGAVGNQYAAEQTRNPGTLGQEQFLMLLIEQLKAQDPLNPQDPTEFTTQLAQFSSLEQLFSLGDALESIAALTASVNNSQASNLLGREIEVAGNGLSVSDGAASTVRYELGQDAVSLTASIYNEDGALARTVDLGPNNAGDGVFNWNGELDNGEIAPDGAYRVEFEATDAAGEDIAVHTTRQGLVTGITYENGTTLLEMDGQRIPITDVLSVRIPTQTE